MPRPPSFANTFGQVASARIAGLYKEASVFAFPSLYEGFGLPVLEAFQVGTPVLTSNTASLPEVAGDAALLVDPGDVRALRDALETVLTDGARAEALRAAGRARAARFTWERTAGETRAVLHEIAL